MSYPITPDPSIHSLPPAVAAQQQQQTITEIEAGANRLLQSILNALLRLLTGGLMGTDMTPSQNAANFFSNLFQNFFNLLGIANPANLLASVEKDVFDSVSTIGNFVSSILAPTGLLHLASDAQNFFDQVWSALTGGAGTGKSAADVASAAAQLAITTNSHADTLAVRDNQSAFLGNGPTEESVFPLANITGGSPVYQNLTPTNALMGFIRIGAPVNKDTVTWLGETTTGLTGFYISVYKMNTTTGDMTLVHQSSNQITSVFNLLAWNTYLIPTGSEIACAAGEVYGIELSVTGSGTYKVVGIDHSWMPNHPTNYPAQLAATRNNANSGVAPGTILNASVNYSTSVAWLGFGVDTGNGFHAPVTVSYSTAGSGSYVIPSWAKYIDVILMGGGGSGSSGGAAGSNGLGGTGGSWSAVTAVMGVDIPLTTTSIAYTVGTGGLSSGGNGGTGGSGTATTASATGWSGGLTAAGGAAGNTVWYGSQASYGAGNETFAGTTYYGGGIQGTWGYDGTSPGGGGAGGAGGQLSGYAGGSGANGVAWFVARSN